MSRELVGGSCLAGNFIAGDICSFAGTISHHQPHQFAHGFGGIKGDNTMPVIVFVIFLSISVSTMLFCFTDLLFLNCSAVLHILISCFQISHPKCHTLYPAFSGRRSKPFRARRCSRRQKDFRPPPRTPTPYNNFVILSVTPLPILPVPAAIAPVYLYLYDMYLYHLIPVRFMPVLSCLLYALLNCESYVFRAPAASCSAAQPPIHYGLITSSGCPPAVPR